MRLPLICGLNNSNEQIHKQYTVNTAYRQSVFLNTPSILKGLLYSTKGMTFRNNVGGPNPVDPKAKQPSTNASHASLPLKSSVCLSLHISRDTTVITSKDYLGVWNNNIEHKHSIWLL